MNRRNFSGALIRSVVASELLFAGGLSVAQQAMPVEGKDFRRLGTSFPTSTSGKIEVLEFFSYACHVCNAFEPELEAWARTLPNDVVLRRVPVWFLGNAQNFQRTYFALESMGLIDSMQSKIFAAVHVERLSLERPEDIASIVGKNGGDAAKFLSLFQSFSVAMAVSRAKKMTSDYGVESIPTLAVQGRFTTSPSQAGGSAKALAVVNALILQVRKG